MPFPPDFIATDRRVRRDGWTPGRQRAFLDALARTGQVASAARIAGISPRAAYRLRADPRAAGFARGWAVAHAASKRPGPHKAPPPPPMPPAADVAGLTRRVAEQQRLLKAVARIDATILARAFADLRAGAAE